MNRRSTIDGGSDLLFQDEIRDAVREAYRSIPAGAGRAVIDRFYDGEPAGLPAVAIDWALGVGDPVAHAELAEGEVVLDIGCGAGVDSVLAARAVGPTGRVIALDTLPEMCERSRAVARAAGVDGWCEVRRGDMEAIPLEDGSVDVIVSNGVLNLSPRKSRAIAEMARVLRPDGRLCFADLVVDQELPPEVLADGAAWAGCIAGAVSEQLLRRKLERHGFTGVTMSHRTPFSVDDAAAYPLFTPELIDVMRAVLPATAQAEIATGVVVRARRAARHDRAGPGFPGGAVASGVTALDAIDPEAAEVPGVTVRHLKRVEDVHLKVLEVAPGCSTPFHTHPHAHEGVIIAGRGRLRLAERAEPLAPGDVFTVNPNAPHAIANPDGPESLRMVCMDCFVE